MEGYSLDKNPIVEALIELRVKGPFRLNQLGPIVREINYSNQEPINRMESIFTSGETVSASASHSKIGFKLSSENGFVAQIVENAIAVSKLAPYKHWEPFRAEAFRCWSIYAKALGIDKVLRVGVRYINRVHIPEVSFRLDKYFELYPELPDRFDGVPMNDFFMRLSIPQGNGGYLILKQGTVFEGPEKKPYIVLDIDLGYDTPDGVSVEEAWNTVDATRDLKNEIFRSLMTDKLEELLK
jgi:uncharacterized protein (TIGR04255 family)